MKKQGVEHSLFHYTEIGENRADAVQFINCTLKTYIGDIRPNTNVYCIWLFWQEGYIQIQRFQGDTNDKQKYPVGLSLINDHSPGINWNDLIDGNNVK